MPTTQWSPSSVLHLDPDSLGSTCIGHAKTQGRRCRNPIAYANRQEAEKILLGMSRLDPQSPRVDDELEELAARLLCRRWHQDQAVTVQRLWQRRIDNFLAAEADRMAELLSAVRTAAARARSTRARSRNTSSVTSVMIHSSLSVTISMVIGEEFRGREDNEPDEEAYRRRPDPETDSSSQQETTPQRTTTQQPNDSPPLPSLTEPATHTPTVLPPEHPTATNEAEALQPPQSASTQSQHSQQHEDSHPSHHERRAIEGDCFICCEDLNNGDNLTWCRAQCGQNAHTDCVSVWHDSQEADERAKTCPYCRTEWAE